MGISVHLLHPMLIGALIAFTWDCGASRESCLIQGHAPYPEVAGTHRLTGSLKSLLPPGV